MLNKITKMAIQRKAMNKMRVLALYGTWEKNVQNDRPKNTQKRENCVVLPVPVADVRSKWSIFLWANDGN